MKSGSTITPIYRNPYIWAGFLFLSASLLIIGWGNSFPLNYSPAEFPVLFEISTLFWLGLWLSFLFLAGLVLTTSNKYGVLAATVLFLILFTSPQFLYLSYGSDAGVLAEYINYSNITGHLDLLRDVSASSYFQWPVSIFFFQFLRDIFHFDEYQSIIFGFLFVIIGIAGGYFSIWYSPPNRQTSSSRAVFWGIALYFCSLYWLLNWQTVPFTFGLIWFFPLLTLARDRSFSARFLILLFFIALIETHPILGVWFICIALILLLYRIWHKKDLVPGLTNTLVFLLIVIQLSLTIFKNLRFFPFVISSLQGFYSQILLISTSDRALLLQTTSALGNIPEDILGYTLKSLGWVSLAFIGFAYLLSSVLVLIKRRYQFRELALLLAGILYFLIGTQVDNIGIRSVMLIAMAPAYFLVDSLRSKSAASKFVLAAGLIGFILFPAALIRSHQNGTNYITPTDLQIRDYLLRMNGSPISNTPILQQHVTPISIGSMYPKISPRRIGYSYEWKCSGPLLLNDTDQLRTELDQISVSLTRALNDLSLSAPQLYDNGVSRLRYIHDCDLLGYSQ